MAYTTITSKGQITIPAEFRKDPGYQPGELVSIHRDSDGRIIVESFDDWIERVRVSIPPERLDKQALTDEELDEVIGQAVVEDYLNENIAMDTSIAQTARER